LPGGLVRRASPSPVQVFERFSCERCVLDRPSLAVAARGPLTAQLRLPRHRPTPLANTSGLEPAKLY
jgi:hypothetical protein